MYNQYSVCYEYGFKFSASPLDYFYHTTACYTVIPMIHLDNNLPNVNRKKFI